MRSPSLLGLLTVIRHGATIPDYLIYRTLCAQYAQAKLVMHLSDIIPRPGFGDRGEEGTHRLPCRPLGLPGRQALAPRAEAHPDRDATAGIRKRRRHMRQGVIAYLPAQGQSGN